MLAGGWTTVITDSLEKVFPDTPPRPIETSIPMVAFLGETVSFQIAFRPPRSTRTRPAGAVTATMRTSAGATASASRVELVPTTLAAYDDHDDGYLRDTPGLYPDLLIPLKPGEPVPSFPSQWRALWFDVAIGDSAPSHVTVEVNLRAETTGEVIAAYTVPVHIVGARLPELDIVVAQWMHCDGLADHYGCDVFSEQHWETIRLFLRKLVELGGNAALTPTWTPPLDTAEGSERTPVQLIGIRERTEGAYDFDFGLLHRWIDTCRDAGIRYLEIPHLFTQWGARFTPAIYVTGDAGLVRSFGWDVEATDPRYRRLLEQLLPALLAELHAHWGLENVFFHISDEPSEDVMESYEAARDVVTDLLSGCVIVDALSDFAFYEAGVVTMPIVATDAAEPFLAAGVDDFWLYYCIAQDKDVANRFLSLPSTRNRILGVQLYLTGARGFLHWGYNFYNSVLSTRSVNPFADTCAGGGFLGGDAFIVYPGPDGVPLESIRSRVFAEAMSDHRSLQLLRALMGHEAVRVLVDPDSRITLRDFSSDPDWYRGLRMRIAQAIVDRI